MDFLTIGDIMDAGLPRAVVQMPEWGGQVEVRAITMAEMQRAKRQSRDPHTKDIDEIKMMALIVEYGCVQPEFAPGQYQALMNKEPGPLTRISDRILELAGLAEPTKPVDGSEQGEA